MLLTVSNKRHPEVPQSKEQQSVVFTHTQKKKKKHATSNTFWETNYRMAGNLIPNNLDHEALLCTMSME